MNKRQLFGLTFGLLHIPFMAAAAGNSAEALLQKIGGNGAPVIIASYTTTAPKLDGKLDDPVWEKAAVRNDFVQLCKEIVSAEATTTVRALYDDQNLYLAFSCTEKEADIKRAYRKDGDPLWLDSCIDMFFAPAESKTIDDLPKDESHYQLIFNSNQAKFSQLGNRGYGSWLGEWEIAAAVTPAGWTAEVKIPFTSLDKRLSTPQNMSYWRMQIGRAAFPGKKREYSALFPCAGLFRGHDYFGMLVFIQDPNGFNFGRRSDYNREIQPELARVEQTLKNGGMSSDSHCAVALSTLSMDFNAADGLQYFVKRENIYRQLTALKAEAATVCRQKLAAQLTKSGQRLLAVPHPAISDFGKVLPEFIPDPAASCKPVKIRLCRNEFEPASIVIWAPEQLQGVTVSIAPVEGVTLAPRWVKCWYQGGSPVCPQNVHSGCYLTPELLLNNDDIVGVDMVNKKNIFREPLALKDKWQYPPDDAEKLQPLALLPSAFAKQLWLTAHASANARPGIYQSKITIAVAGNTLAEVPLQVEVMEFDLQPSKLISGCYYNTSWGKKPKVKAESEMRNLVDHGITAVGLREDAKDLSTVVEMMKRIGLPVEPLYIENSTRPEILQKADLNHKDYLSKARTRITEWTDAAKKAQVKTLYLYLIDEPKGETITKQIPVADLVHQAGAKTWDAFNLGPGYRQLAGNSIDAVVYNGNPTREAAAAAHKDGGTIYSYDNPQLGIEFTEVYRRNFGLLLWQNDFDGSFNFAWFWLFVDHAKKIPSHPWDDFDSSGFRDHCMMYPTVNGCVDTVQGEGWREGVDDCRYLSTLEYWIAHASNAKAAAAAAAWLKQLKDGEVAALTDLDGVRSTMIEHIRACQSR
ncbi:MAG: carbohydrate-binding family 9-like protein [Lentisphaerota bacterium]